MNINLNRRALLACCRNLCLALVTAASITALPALAQDFPGKRIRLLIGQPSGGGSDVLARLLGDKLTQIWNQPVIVESLPGASGSIAMNAVIRSAPD